MERFKLTDIQAQAILDMRLKTLSGLQREKIEEEYNELMKLIAHLRDILNSETLVFQVVKEELLKIKEKFGDERLTKIKAAEGELDNMGIRPEKIAEFKNAYRNQMESIRQTENYEEIDKRVERSKCHRHYSKRNEEEHPEQISPAETNFQQECVVEEILRYWQQLVWLNYLCRCFLHTEPGKEVDDEEYNETAIDDVIRFGTFILQHISEKKSEKHKIHSPDQKTNGPIP